jgi:hypothetical protein
MSRFAQTYEDPEYEYEGSDDESTWQDVDTAPLGAIVDSWVRKTVAEQPQDPYSPFQTINS